MAAMAAEQTTVAMLSHFFVFNPLFGPTDETEHQKLLFHYPADLQMDQKLKNVGLSEALVNFTRYSARAPGGPASRGRPRPPDLHAAHALRRRCDASPTPRSTFSPDRPCEIVHTVKRRMVFFNPEPNYWMVMVRTRAGPGRRIGRTDAHAAIPAVPRRGPRAVGPAVH